MILILLMFTVDCQASAKKLIAEFLKNNSSVVQSRSEYAVKSLEKARVLATKSWLLGLSGSYYKNELDGTVVKGANTNYSLSLNKDFNWGGHFAISNGYGKVDTFPSSFMPQATSNYEFTQTISYSQDLGQNFFGMDDRGEIKVAKRVDALGKADMDHSIQGRLLNFNGQLIEMRLRRTLVQLEKKALARAIRRRKIINRRVSDGLLEKVDFYQASMVELARKEAVEASVINQNMASRRVSSLLHKKVTPDQVEIYTQDRSIEIPGGSWNSSTEEHLLKKSVDLLKSNMRRVNYSFVPEINITTMYKTNSYDAMGSDAIKNGSLCGDKAELSVGINLSMPLWFGPQRVEKERLNIELQAAQAVYRKRQTSFRQEERLLRAQIELLDKNIESAKKRIILAKKVLKEYNKLYGLGRADLDQVIRSEEDLISTEKSYITYLSQKDELISNLAYLLGGLHEYLLRSELK